MGLLVIVSSFVFLFLSILSTQAQAVELPSERFDLTYWRLTMPSSGASGDARSYDGRRLKKRSHPYFFHLDEKGRLVFASPNKGATTSNSTNTRSELRQMIRGANSNIKAKGPKNNFAIKSNRKSRKFGQIGGKLNAKLHVNHVATFAGHPEKLPAYGVVVGQIHAGKDRLLTKKGFGWGNEPIKIYFKKWPEHENGSVFWTYERNLEKNDPNRVDIAYPVWGNTWENSDNPGQKGIALGEDFSYEINVYQDTMHLTFKTDRHEPVYFSVNLSTNIDPFGKVDLLDNPKGYTEDWFYFKAGAYNQCSTTDKEGFWYTACSGTGNWEEDVKNGDYTKVTFSTIELSEGTKPVAPMAKK